MTEMPAHAPVTARPTRFVTADGRTLSGLWLAPMRRPRMAVALHGATGAPARFYRPFAQWLAAAHGAATLIYDYRDWGPSAERPLAEVSTSMADWGLRDQPAALAHVLDTFPDIPTRVIGHSLGGHWLAFHAGIERVDRVAAVASGPAYWRAHPWVRMPAVAALWWLAGPLATSLMGYLPGTALGLGADLPAQVYWQWRRWCLTPGYSRSDWGRTLPEPDLDKARFRLGLVAVGDDWMIPPKVVWKLADFYPNAAVERTLIEPAAVGLRSIGHLAVFRERSRAAWPLIAAPLVD